MLVTDLAYQEMEARADGLTDRIGRLFRRCFRRTQPIANAGDPFAFSAEHRAHLHLVAEPAAQPDRAPAADAATAGDFRWRRHPQLLNQGHATTAQSEETGRGARSAAVRGLFLARSRRFDEARDAFAIAAADSSVDLAAVPGFWDLSRGGMMAAVQAYEDVERFREASALGARIRLMYRPRSVSAVPELPSPRKSASGS